MIRKIAMLSALWINVSGAQVKTIDNPGGGHIYLGALAGQPTPQEAFGKTLHQVSVFCGDRPQLGQLVQNKNGDLLADHDVFVKQYAKAEALSLHDYAIMTKALGPDHPKTQVAVQRLVGLYTVWGRPDKATEFRSKLTAPHA